MYGTKPYGLRSVKIVSEDDSTVVALDAPQTFSFTERIKTSELAGRDATVAIASYTDAVEWELEAGGLPLDAYALMTGRSVTVTGSSPNETTSLVGHTGDVFPYFKVYGQAIGQGDDGGDVHCKLNRVKITTLEGGLADGEFWITKCGGIGIGNDENQAFEFVQNETITPLP